MQLAFISYKGMRPDESHPHAQIVLAVEGGMEIEIGGKTGTLDPGVCAFVPTGVIHSQEAAADNTFLLVNCDEPEIGGPLAEQLAGRVFLPVSSATRQLIGFAEAAQREGLPLEVLAGNWAQLLVTALASRPPSMADSRLIRLAARVESSLEQPWTVREMAACAALSPSRLHAVFQGKMKRTPQEWLAELRIRKVRQWLAETDIPIAELALRAGYADQSVLTRIMRRVTGQTPAAYRRAQQEIWSKFQE